MREEPGYDLQSELLDAHGDHAIDRLAHLYRQAALIEEAAGRIDAACFFLTQAYVFALEAGLPEQADIAARLQAHAREPAV